MPESTPGRTRSAGSQRPPREARNLDRRDTLRSLAAELSAAADAAIHADDPAAAAALLRSRSTPTLTLPPPRRERRDQATTPTRPDLAAPVDDDDFDFAELRRAASGGEGAVEADSAPATMDLTGRYEEPAAAAPPDVPAADLPAEPVHDSDVERLSVQLEMARAEANILAAKYDAELAARVAAERRLAATEDELQFLRAEMQMVGETPHKTPGPIGRALRRLGGPQRPGGTTSPTRTRK